MSVRWPNEVTIVARLYRNTYAAVTAAIVLILVIPLLLVHYAPLVDYPNHLARAFILRHYIDVPSFAEAYTRTLVPIPNVAIDVIVVALQYVLPPVLAGKVFLIGVVLLWCAGCHLLGRAANGGRATWLAPPCMLLAYHGPFQYGFVNYALGLGVFFVATACWITYRAHWTVGRVATIAVLAIAAYLAHLSSYALLGVTAFVITLYDLTRRRITLAGAVTGGVPFVPPLLLFAKFMRGGGRVGRVEWNTLEGKAVALFSLIRAYSLRWDVVFAVALALVAAAAFVAARRYGRVQAHGALLASSLVLFVLFLACPKDLFTSGGADVRVVPAAIVLFVLSWRLEMPRPVATPLFVATVMLLLARLSTISVAWSDLDNRVAQSIGILDHLPEGARLLPMFTPSSGTDAAKRDRVLEHSPYYAVITRHAYVPLLFAVPSQQPLVARRYVWGTVLAGQIFDSHLSEFDYVWTFQPPSEIAKRLHACCDLVAENGAIALWRVRRSKATM